MTTSHAACRARSAKNHLLRITDAGPTLWLDGGRWRFHWPPEQAAEWQTLREVRRCQREGIVVNVFMLSDEPYLKHFVNQMATVNRGRAFYVHPDNLGEYLLIDYLSHKQKHVS